ncbi:fimbrial biogenesis chaperone [Allosphingosinicella sp.]|jgi:fimbrial chaperone protein|uniref:fimbrial biogenesis chaperone n=1 Tax=Allosphingosinicella sp. TaxID=2823234 RepID=UPI002EF90C49
MTTLTNVNIIGSLRRTALFLAAALVTATPAPAGTLQVDPIRLEISAGRRTATLRVRNEEQVPVAIRAYPLEWNQIDGEDLYSDTSAVIVSPPIFTIPAGGTQIVRVGLRTASAEPRAYRLIVEEVPQASPSGGVQVALRLNLPLFSSIAPGAQSELSWAASRGADGRWTIEASNPGRNYVRIEPAAAEAAIGVDLDSGLNLGVVLPASSRRWTIGEAPVVMDRARFTSIVRGTNDAEAQLAGRRD